VSNDGTKALAIAIVVLALIAWNGTILIGTAYIVFWLGYSGWWWLLAVVLMSGSASASDKVSS
jgi:hypothetical protein